VSLGRAVRSVSLAAASSNPVVSLSNHGKARAAVLRQTQDEGVFAARLLAQACSGDYDGRKRRRLRDERTCGSSSSTRIPARI
jgi:hypothetical protein